MQDRLSFESTVTIDGQQLKIPVFAEGNAFQTRQDQYDYLSENFYIKGPSIADLDDTTIAKAVGASRLLENITRVSFSEVFGFRNDLRELPVDGKNEILYINSQLKQDVLSQTETLLGGQQRGVLASGIADAVQSTVVTDVSLANSAGLIKFTGASKVLAFTGVASGAMSAVATADSLNTLGRGSADINSLKLIGTLLATHQDYAELLFVTMLSLQRAFSDIGQGGDVRTVLANGNITEQHLSELSGGVTLAKQTVVGADSTLALLQKAVEEYETRAVSDGFLDFLKGLGESVVNAALLSNPVSFSVRAPDLIDALDAAADRLELFGDEVTWKDVFAQGAIVAFDTDAVIGETAESIEVLRNIQGLAGLVNEAGQEAASNVFTPDNLAAEVGFLDDEARESYGQIVNELSGTDSRTDNLPDPILELTFDGSVQDTGPNKIAMSVDGTTPVADVNNRSGFARDFNGSSDEVVTESNKALEVSSNFSFSGWIRPDGEGRGGVAVQGTVFDTTGNWQIYADENEVVFGSNNSSGVFGDSPRIDLGGATDTWHHIAFTWDDGLVKGYKNGVLQYTFDAASRGITDLNSTDDGVKIGTDEYQGDYFSGAIDDVRIYNETLRAETVETLAGRKPNEEPDSGSDEEGGDAGKFDFPELTIPEQVAGMYVGYYGRAPDPAGRSFWTAEYERLLREGKSRPEIIDDIAEDFRFADETLAEYPFLDPSSLQEAGFEAGTRDPHVGFLKKANTDGHDRVEIGGRAAEFGQGGDDTLVFEGTSSTQPGLGLGGPGGDTYVVRGNETGVVFDGFGSDGDTVEYPLGFNSTFFAILENEHLLLTSFSGNTAVIVADWRETDHKIENFDLAGDLRSFSQINSLAQTNGDRFVGNLTIEEALTESFQSVPFSPDDLREAFQYYDNATISSGPTGAPRDFLKNAYENLFNRQIDQPGLEFWVGEINRRLDSGEEIGNIITKIIAGAGDDDADTLLNKIEVGNAYADNVADGSFDREDAVDIVARVGSDRSSVDDASDGGSDGGSEPQASLRFQEAFNDASDWSARASGNAESETGFAFASRGDGDQYLEATVADQNDDWFALARSPSFDAIEPGQSFTLEFDFNPISPDWGHYPGVEFGNSDWDGSRATRADNLGLQFRISWSDNVLKEFQLSSSGITDGNAGNGNRVSTPTIPQTDAWYDVTINHNADAGSLGLEIREPDGDLFYETTVEDFTLPTEIDEVRFGEQGSGPAYGDSATIGIDNVEITAGQSDNDNQELFRVTENEYSVANAESGVASEFGDGYRLADWADIQDAWENGYEDYLSEVFEDGGGTVTRNGDEYWSGDRSYFVSDHDGSTPSGWLDHDNVGSHEIDLGSWFAPREAVAVNEELIEEVGLSPQVNADVTVG